MRRFLRDEPKWFEVDQSRFTRLELKLSESFRESECSVLLTVQFLFRHAKSPNTPKALRHKAQGCRASGYPGEETDRE